MAIIYCRSTDGYNADSGATWALAKADLNTATTGALAVAPAGSTIYLSSSHSQSYTSGLLSLNAVGSSGAPVSILSVDDTSEPPINLLSGAQVYCNNATTLSGRAIYSGVTFKCDNSINIGDVNPGGLTFDNCEFYLSNTSSTCFLNIGPSISTANDDWLTQWNNVIFNSDYRHEIVLRHGRFRWNGGQVQGLLSAYMLYVLSVMTGSTIDAIITGVDFSAMGTSSIVKGSTAASGSIIFRGCKIPSSGNSLVFGDIPGPGGLEIIFDNCDSGDTTYRSERYVFGGVTYTDTGVYRIGGASVNNTPQSIRMVASTLPSFIYPLNSVPLMVANDVEGANVTVAVEVAQDNGALALTESEIWLEVEYLNTDGFPILSKITDNNSTLLTKSTTEQSASIATWNGLTNPTRQKLAVTIAPQGKGYLQCRVCLAKPSTTVYVDPLPVVS